MRLWANLTMLDLKFYLWKMGMIIASTFSILWPLDNSITISITIARHCHFPWPTLFIGLSSTHLTVFVFTTPFCLLVSIMHTIKAKCTLSYTHAARDSYMRQFWRMRHRGNLYGTQKTFAVPNKMTQCMEPWQPWLTINKRYPEWQRC